MGTVTVQYAYKPLRLPLRLLHLPLPYDSCVAPLLSLASPLLVEDLPVPRVERPHVVLAFIPRDGVDRAKPLSLQLRDDLRRAQIALHQRRQRLFHFRVKLIVVNLCILVERLAHVDRPLCSLEPRQRLQGAGGAVWNVNGKKIKLCSRRSLRLPIRASRRITTIIVLYKDVMSG